ncbi:pentatricopeptide repeat-containing protein [Tanacetum coccineum]
MERPNDKGKGIMLEDDNLVTKKRKALSRGNSIVITENENPSFEYDSDSDSDTNRAAHNHYDIQMNVSSESESEESDRDTSDYENIETGPESISQPKRVVDISVNATVLEHEAYMEALMKKLRGSECGKKDPFTVVEKSGDKYPVYDEGTHWNMRKPHIGDKFPNGEKFKECLTYYALANGFSLWFYRSSKDQIIARCGQRKEKLKDPSKGKQRSYKKFPSETSGKTDCPWRCYGKTMKEETSFQVISMMDVHTCVRNFYYGRLVNYKWIGKHYGDKIRLNPKIKLHEIADMVMKKYSCIISPNQCRSAKTWAINERESAIEDHYGMVRSYAMALLESNVGSTVKLGCRKIIALDGCFLKKPNNGEILTAVGRDGNNHIFPVAWAIVTVENKYNWRWFLDLLGDDLDIQNGHGLALMSLSTRLAL